jgi:ABC-type sugar transport system ATPase subunit
LTPRRKKHNGKCNVRPRLQAVWRGDGCQRPEHHVEDKEFLVFVGPSGCGKTTSLRCLAGLEEISDGNILIGDRVVNDVPPKDRDIAMVFQSYALYPHMSVYDNMAFGLKLRKTPQGRN